MADFLITPTNTGESLAAQSSDLTRLMWQEGCDRFMENADFFSEFEGGMDAPIAVKNDFSKGAGSTLIFTQLSGFYQEPKRGSENFETQDDFQKIKTNTNRLKIDWFRGACRWDERMEEYLGMRGEIVAGVPEMLGDWMGRFKSEQMAMMFKRRGNTANYMFPVGISTVDGLTKSHTLDYSLAMHGTSKLKTMNGKPAQIGTVGRNKIKKYVIVALTESLLSLELDPTYQAQLETADVRGDENYLFKGGFRNLRGHAIKEWSNVDHDGDGALGTPFNPKARLGVAVTAANTAQAIKGGGNATAADEVNTLYFKWFPGYRYKWIVDDQISIAEAAAQLPFYLVIHNDGVESSEGAGDGHKWGFYRISANAGTSLTMDQRLRAAASGIALTTVGNVTWNAAVNTDKHPANAFMFLANSSGLPIMDTLVLGAHAARRGYGKYKNTRGDDSHEAGFVQEIFIKSVFGQGLRQDRRGNYPGFLMLRHVGTYPGIDTTNAVLAS